MINWFNFHKNKSIKKHYKTLLLIIIAAIIAIIGLMALKDAFFPLILSALWAFLIKSVKNSIKSYFD